MEVDNGALEDYTVTILSLTNNGFSTSMLVSQSVPEIEIMAA